MKIIKVSIGLFFFLSLSNFSSAQTRLTGPQLGFCYSYLNCQQTHHHMVKVGNFKATDGSGGHEEGSRNPIFIVDKDDSYAGEIGATYDGDYGPYSISTTVVDKLDRMVMLQDRTGSDPTSYCFSRDFFYIKPIDTKFSVKHLPNCAGIEITNESVPFTGVPPVADYDVSPLFINETVETFPAIPKSIATHPISIKYDKPMADYLQYEFIVKNFATNQISVYPSTVGEVLVLPNGNYNVELKIKGIDDMFNLSQWNNVYANELRRTINKKGCGSITLYNIKYTKSGTYWHTIKNASGCDSVIILNLTILRPSTSTVNRIACGSFVFNGKTYNSPGTYQHVLTNKAGCDSVITLNLSLPIFANNIEALNCGAIDLGELSSLIPYKFRSTDNNSNRANNYNITQFPKHYNAQPSGEVVYKFTSNYSRNIIKLCGSDFDTYLHVLDDAGNLIIENDDSEGYYGPTRFACSETLSYQSALTVTLPKPGVYYIIAEGYGSSTGNIILTATINTTSYGREGNTDESIDRTNILMSPNPASSQLTITLPLNEPANVKLFDLTGRLVKDIIINQQEPINISELASGLYTATVIQGGKVYSEKVHVLK